MGRIKKYAKKNNWVDKKKASAVSTGKLLDMSKLARSSDALESIIERAFISVSSSSSAEEVDTKALKELTSTLKEAINIKQNIFLLPIITEQKQYEHRSCFSDTSSENEIRITLDDSLDQYSV